MPDSDFLGALRALDEGGVEFAVVGGLAAVLNGAPVNTFDLDIVPARDEENVADRKSTRLNSSHRCISYSALCLNKRAGLSKSYFSHQSRRMTRTPGRENISL